MFFFVNTLINLAVGVFMFFNPFSQVLAGAICFSFCFTLAFIFGRNRSRSRVFILAVIITVTRTIIIT
jgi:hypothetical protein